MKARLIYLCAIGAFVFSPSVLPVTAGVPSVSPSAQEAIPGMRLKSVETDFGMSPDNLMKLNHKKLPYATDGSGVTVKINLDYASNEYKPQYFYMYNEDVFFGGLVSNYADESQKVINLEDISEGVYTVFVSFEELTSHAGTPWIKCYVFDEEREINGDTEFTMTASDAKNQFVGRSFLPGGEEAVLDNDGYDENYNPKFIPGNVRRKYIQTTIFDEKYNAYIVSSIVGTGTYDMDNIYGPGVHWRLETKEDFFVNDISDRFVICQQRDNYTENGLVSTSAFSRGLSNMALENDWHEYSEVSEYFDHTPAYDIYGGPDTYFRFTSYGYGPISLFSYDALPWAMDTTPTTLFYSTSENASDFQNAHPSYHFSLFDVQDGWYENHLKGQRIVFTGIEGAYEFSNYSLPPEFSGMMALDEEGEEIYYDYPGHPAFRVLLDGSVNNYRYGNSAPVNAVNSQIYKIGENFVTRFAPEYRGLLGEIREADLIDVSVEAYCNGEFMADNYNWNEFWSSVPWDNDKDVYTATLTNRNILVDGMEGFNITSLEFSYGRDDICPPMIQNLQFRNKDGKFTRSFSSFSDMRAYVCAGDYNWIENENGIYYNYDSNPLNIKVEIRPHGQENLSWIELEAMNVEEYNNIAGYGLFYDCKMPASVEGLKDGWYDIRISAIDSAGNHNIQEIGPVFEIIANTGTESVEVADNEIKLIDGGIYAVDREAKWSVYSVDGRLMFESIGNTIDLSALPSGIYMVQALANGNIETIKISK